MSAVLEAPPQQPAGAPSQPDAPPRRPSDRKVVKPPRKYRHLVNGSPAAVRPIRPAFLLPAPPRPDRRQEPATVAVAPIAEKAPAVVEEDPREVEPAPSAKRATPRRSRWMSPAKATLVGFGSTATVHSVEATPKAITTIRMARTVAGGVVVGAVTMILVALTVPTLFGFHNFIVMSGSMEPAIHVGDVVIDRPVSPLDVRVGDVITFKDPSDQDTLITHRVRAMHVRGTMVRLVTKGDAANGVQRWNIPVTGRLGRVVTHVPRLGFVLYWVTTPLGRLLMIVLPAASLGVIELRRIWRPGSKRGRRAAVA